MQFHMAFSKPPVDLVHKKFNLPLDKCSKFVNSFIEFGADRTCIIYEMFSCCNLKRMSETNSYNSKPNKSVCLPFC